MAKEPLLHDTSDFDREGGFDISVPVSAKKKVETNTEKKKKKVYAANQTLKITEEALFKFKVVSPFVKETEDLDKETATNVVEGLIDFYVKNMSKEDKKRHDALVELMGSFNNKK